MSKLKKLGKFTLTAILKLAFYIVLGFFIWQGAKYAYSFGHDIFFEHSVEAEPGRSFEIVIEEGMDTAGVAELLYDKGLIRNKLAYEVQAVFFDFETKAGTYKLSTAQSNRQMLEIINSGVQEE